MGSASGSLTAILSSFESRYLYSVCGAEIVFTLIPKIFDSSNHFTAYLIELITLSSGFFRDISNSTIPALSPLQIAAGSKLLAPTGLSVRLLCC